MKTAIIGSRNLTIDNLEEYLPQGTTEIISGGAKGIDTCAEELANSLGIGLTVIRPDYRRYGAGAPIKRNDEIISLADTVIAIWDGESRGTKYVIEKCQKLGKPVIVKIV
ncbi:MAG: hypothetical protein IJ424_02375 [Oscillospiraceae bacterium]|nr:hypothetical protein [Oscillospiraceae bacterium]